MTTKTKTLEPLELLEPESGNKRKAPASRNMRGGGFCFYEEEFGEEEVIAARHSVAGQKITWNPLCPPRSYKKNN